MLNALIGVVHWSADEPHAVVGRATQPVTDHPLVEPQPPVNDLCLADLERDKHEHDVDCRQDSEDPDVLPERGGVELLHCGEQAVALVGEEDIEPDRHDGQQQQQRDGQDRPPARASRDAAG